MTQVISLLNLQHGGGKTTAVVNLATALHRRGSNVLAVDLDPEAQLSGRVRTSTGTRREPSEDARVVLTAEGWCVMPSQVSTMLLHDRILYRVIRNTVFYDELRALFDGYDYVLIDCSTDELAVIVEALALTDQIILPFDSKSLEFYDAVEKLSKLFAARVTINPNLKLGGVFLAEYDPQLRQARKTLTALADVLGKVTCFSAYLPELEEIRLAQQRRVSVIEDAPTSRAAIMFTLLAEQMLESILPRLTATVATPETVFPMVLELAAATVERSLVPLNPSANWIELAAHTNDKGQAMRYAALALSQEPANCTVIELFETRLMDRIWSVGSHEVDSLIAMGRFLTEHGFDHYAAQLFRRATDLNPNAVGAWAGIVRTSHSDIEREHALQMCLQLDEGLAAAEAPEPPKRTPQLVAGKPRAAVPALTSLQNAA